jgi:curli biogenesis system outer membrane secretion channel CsgG
MNGGPIESAQQALVTGLRALAPSDKFNVIAFDNLQEYLSEKGLVQATPEAIEAAVAWVLAKCFARGGAITVCS